MPTQSGRRRTPGPRAAGPLSSQPQATTTSLHTSRNWPTTTSNLSQHHLDFASEAEGRELARRGGIMSSSGATTWAEACQHMVDQAWSADFTEITSTNRVLAAQLGLLSDQICGGVNADYADLCGGVNLLNDGLSALDSGTDAAVGGVESLTDILDGATDFFGP